MTLSILLLFSGSAVATLIFELNSRLESYDVTGLLGGDGRPDHQATTQGDKSLLDPFAGRAVNLLVFGVDSRDGDNATYAKDDVDGAVLNDVNMVVHLSADRRRVDVVAIPRDTMVDLPPCQGPDGYEHYGWWAQINAAWGHGSAGDFGNKAEGIACVWRTVESVTNIKLDGYLMVDFSGFVGMVDALGGVDMCLEESFRGTGLIIELEAGQQHLNGGQALRYARTRKGYSGDQRLSGSDTDRISRQQQLIAAVVHKVLAEKSLSSLPKLNSFAVALTGSLIVSPQLDSVTELAGLAYSLRHLEMTAISMMTAPVVTYPADTNRLLLDDYGGSNEMGMTAQELFDYLARDHLIPGTVPWKVANPWAIRSSAEPTSNPGELGSAPPTNGGGSGKPTGQPANPGRVTPDKGIQNVLDAPVACNPH